ncbi:S8 family serine peptidase [Ruegeria sp. R14_0]|uniref:S8 family serine peptidase n=1 Tax=Ruegeria sp. R14_0 TaxID=2821100 RepID=UPI001ADA9B28|nr:S8 family serine peptidase [Ruegeria sp. R14_0]MBO9447378.1 S8 family serine peptidase [Ruegeria sp. R14_0]
MRKISTQLFKASLVLSLLLPLQLAVPMDWKLSFVSVAWADEDDDDDGDDDRDDDGDGGGNDGAGGGQRSSGENPLGNLIRRLTNRPPAPQPAQAPAPVVLPTRAPAEIVVADASSEDLEQLLSEGFAITATVVLEASDRVLTRLIAPDGQDLEAARNRVRALPTGSAADFNHYYRFEQSEARVASSSPCLHENCPAWEMIQWPRSDVVQTTCPVQIPVGMIDTGINADHEIMAGARLEVVQLADQTLAPSKAIHGTAVASLMIGDPNSRVPGLIHGAEVIAVDVFARKGSDERADVVSLLRGLDVLKARGVRVVNLSLTGPNNSLLEEIVNQMVEEDGIVLVAAAGNEGPSGDPRYPAAFDTVLAVTAVDARTRIYRKAQRGPHIDLTAPGVNMLSATSIRGARLKSGTSFAVPFVTAAVAIMLSQDGALSPDQVRERLRSTAQDLGAPGADEVFGHGLLNAATLC